MKDEAWERATKLVVDHFVELLILAVVLAVIIIVILAVIAGLADIVGVVSALAALFVSFVLGGIAAGFLIGWYVSAMFSASDALHRKERVNYVGCVQHGLSRLLSRKKVLGLILGLGLISGLVGMVFGVVLGGAGALIGDVISGALLSAAAAYALMMLNLKEDGTNLGRFFGEINNGSSNNGLFVYIAVLVRIIPVVGAVIQFVCLPLAVVIVGSHKAHKEHTAK